MENEFIKSNKAALTALSSLHNAKKSDRVLWMFFAALGIDVPIGECSMYTDLLEGRSEILGELRASICKRFQDVWGRVAKTLNETKKGETGRKEITASMAFRLNLKDTDQRRSGLIVEAYKVALAANTTAMTEEEKKVS